MGEREAVSVSRSYLEWKINDCKIKFIFAKQKKTTATTTTRTSAAAAAPGRQSGRRAVAFLLDFACSVGSSLSLSRFLSLYHYLPCSVCLALPPSILVSECVCVQNLCCYLRRCCCAATALLLSWVLVVVAGTLPN